jgi:hypothetical protein
MRAFEVFLNGKRLCVAGIGADGVLTTTVTYCPVRGKDDTRLYVGGLVLPQEEHVFWKQSVLADGDELRIKIVNARTVDEPRKRTPRDPAEQAKTEKWQLQVLAKKSGWKIQKNKKQK